MTFEWDEDKNLDNIQKHNVSFEIAQEAFFDEKRIIIRDKKHSKKRIDFFVLEMTEMEQARSNRQMVSKRISCQSFSVSCLTGIWIRFDNGAVHRCHAAVPDRVFLLLLSSYRPGGLLLRNS